MCLVVIYQQTIFDNALHYVHSNKPPTTEYLVFILLLLRIQSVY